ncbi:hypothetical protein AB0O86_19325 [Streptomyces hirsutus]|uniref:hypothetical protein n=1 Tax=Streptomyces hirsutus TaxID=35620 RepID=UPI00341841BA
MYGHGAAPPHRSTATVITLRVLIAAAGFLSCGLLSCVPLFRVAVLRGRFLDWLMAWVSLPLSLALLMTLGRLPDEHPWVGPLIIVALALSIAAPGYYLTVDIRHHHELIRRGAYGPQPPHVMPMHAPGGTPVPYGYPQSTSPYGHTPVPQPQPPLVQPPQQPGPARIDQVRAELDELSDYLRRSDGGQGGGGTGGRGHGDDRGGR